MGRACAPRPCPRRGGDSPAPLQQERGTASAVPLSCRLRPRGGGRTAARNPGGQGVRSEALSEKGRASLQQERGTALAVPSPAVRPRAAVGEPHPEPRRAGRALRGPAREGARICAAGEGDGVSRPPLLPSAPARWWENRSAEPRRAGRALRGPAREGARIFAAGEGTASAVPSPAVRPRAVVGEPHPEPRRPGRALRSPAREGAGIALRPYSKRGGQRQPSPLGLSAPARRARKNAVSAASHSCRRTPPRACTPPPSAGSRCRA